MLSKVKTNIIYNVLLQVVMMVLPLITEPYVSRVLGTEGIGIYNFTYSMAQYFIIIGSLGISVYGNRQIAYFRDDKSELSKTFWSVFYLRLFTMTISTMMFVLVFWNAANYNMAYRIQVISIFVSALDISWFYMGLEEFKKTVFRSLMIKMLFLVCTFLFVKDAGDTNLYILFSALSLFLGNAVLWISLNQFVKFVKVSSKDILRHFIPTIQLFIPQIAIQVYVVLDKSILGYLSTVEQVGLYSQAEKIVKSGLSVVSAVGTAMLPRMSNLFAKGEMKQFRRYLNLSLNGLSCLSVAIVFGVAGIAKEFVGWFLGNEFIYSGELIQIMTPIIFFMALSNILGNQFLIPSKRHREFTIAVTAGALINLTANMILIPRYAAAGACIATLAAEAMVTIIELCYARNYINFKQFGPNSIKYIVMGCMMYIVCRMIAYILQGKNYFLVNVIQMTAGAAFYVGMLIFTRDKMFFAMLPSKAKKQIKEAGSDE